jgi:3-hydroxyisobutyrate dehydrogenase-like beta-hydroxyacid dehydrogenase
LQVGFIGLGRMGSAMAANLLAAGHGVTVYNRSADKTAPLAERGAMVASTPAGACRGEAVITMVADDAALEAVVFGADGILAGLAAGATHLAMSTIAVALAERLTDSHAAGGQHFVSAPVFGRPDAAAAAKLFIVAAGKREAVAGVQPLLDAMGQRTFVIAERPTSANLVKLSGNFLLASLIEALGEAMTLVGKAGIDRRAYLELLTSTLFTAPPYRTYGALIAEERFTPAGFAAPLGLKDVRLTLAAAEELGVPMPLASLVRDRLLALVAQGGEELDWSAISRLAAQDAGLGKT